MRAILQSDKIRKFLSLLAITFGTIPIPLILFSLNAPSLLPYVWLLPAVYLLLATVSLYVPGKWRLLYGIAGTCLMTGLSISFLFLHFAFGLIPVVLVYSGIFLWSMRVATWGADQEIPGLWIYIGITIHLITQFVLFAARTFGNSLYESVSPWCLVFFFLFAFLAMFCLNRGTLTLATSGKQQVSDSMRLRNLLLTGSLFAVGVLLALVPAITKVVSNLISLVVKFFAWLPSLIPSQKSTTIEETEPDATAITENLGSIEIHENGVVDAMNSFLQILAPVIIGGVLLFLGCLVCLLLIRLFKFLLRYVSNYTSAVSGDYIDEVSDTRESGEMGAARKGTSPRTRFGRSDRSLPPRERIRYRYRLLLNRHKDWSRASTARENLPDDLSPLYERARYSEHPITEEDAASFSTGAKRV